MAGAEEGSPKATLWQSDAEQKVVTGEVEMTVEQRKRKAEEEAAAVKWEAFDPLLEQEKARAAAAFPEADVEEDEDSEEDEYEFSYPSLEEELKIAKAALSAFPEAAALGPDELEVAASRLVEQSKPEKYASQVKTRLSHDDIWLILALTREKGEGEATGREYLASLESLLSDPSSRSAFPDGWLEERKREHLELQPFSEKVRNDFEAFQAKVRTDLIYKGFVEVGKDYWENRASVEACFKEEWEHIPEWKHLDLGRIKIAKPE